MDLVLAVAADYANRSNEGKLNIMGIFQELTPQAFPAALTQGFLVLAWEADPPEVETQKDVRFAFTDPDGDETVSLEMQVQVPQAGRPGSRALFNRYLQSSGKG